MKNNITAPLVQTVPISFSRTRKLHKNSIKFMPAGLFGSTVALAGLSLAFKQSSSLFGIPIITGNLLGIFSWLIFILLTFCYSFKIIRYPENVKAELTDAVKANFLGTFFISAVLLSSVAAPYYLALAQLTWIAGTIGGLIFMYVLTTRLYKGELNALDAVPPTLIPGLTVLNAVTTSSALHFSWWDNEYNLFLFSIGMIYVMVFFVIITYRLIHLEPVSLFLRPTLLLMSAPFEIGFSSYLSTRAQLDSFASVLFYFGIYIFVVLFFIIFKRKLPYMISWWGACFSMGALTNAALRYAGLSDDPLLKNIALILLTLTSIMILLTATYTCKKLIAGRLLNA